MAILQNVLLGVLVGYYLAFAKVDSVWWPYLGQNPSALKSKIPATMRANGQAFYRSLHDSTYNFDYFLLSCSIILLLSFVGGIVQLKSKRIQYVASLLVFSVGLAVEFLYARPAMLNVTGKAAKLLNNLYNVAYYHAIVFACLVITALIQISTEAEAEYEEEPVKTKKKSTKVE